MHLFKRQASAHTHRRAADKGGCTEDAREERGGSGSGCSPHTGAASADVSPGPTNRVAGHTSPMRAFPASPPQEASSSAAATAAAVAGAAKPPSGTVVRPMQMKVRLSFRTDIGGMHENQDDCFVWRHPGSGSVVIGILDGHGRDVGQLASACVKEFMMGWLNHRWGELVADPAEAFRTMFAEAHASMLHSFREHLTAQGWTVKEQGGYLMKRRSLAQPWTCVHGGTSGSVVAIVEGKRLLVANVGDSCCLLAATDRELRVEDLVQHSFWEDGGGVMEACTDQGTVGHVQAAGSGVSGGGHVNAADNGGSGGGGDCGAGGAPDGIQTLLLTADHSPESPREFCRMRFTHPSPNNPRLPNLLVVYDSPTPNKLKCNPVFEVEESGVPRITGRGRYYKNVRREWASLVATPPRARFQDALAFTRSIGDYHLQTYGVTHVPDVMSFDLAEVYHRPQRDTPPPPPPAAVAAAAAAEASGGVCSEAAGTTSGSEMLVCLVCASDGIWDNWAWDDVSRYFLAPPRVQQVRETNSSDVAMEEFMLENDRRAKANFGSQADNATAVCCYLFITSE